MTMVLKLKLTLFLVVLWSLNADALRCLTCSGTQHPWLCTTAKKCSDHENACGIKKYTTINGETRFDVGCITDSFCRSVEGKRNLFDDRPHGNEGQTVCQECCHGEFCNSRGCGSNGHHIKRGPICFSCTQISDPEECSTLAFCSENEVCKVFEERIFDNVFSHSRCTALSECDQPAGLFGKRQSLEGLCTACCNSDYCNDRCLGDAVLNLGVNSTTSTAVTTPATNTDLEKEFLLMFPYVWNTYNMYIVMMADTPGTAQLEMPHLNTIKTINIEAGRNNFTLSNNMEADKEFVKTQKGIYLKSSVPLTVWVILDEAPGYSRSTSALGYSALPVEKLGKHYKLTSLGSFNQVTIGAKSDNTTVIIQCLEHIQLNLSGNVCDSNSNVTLKMNRLETVSFYSVYLTGIAIISDKDVSVIIGNQGPNYGSYFFNIRNSSLTFSLSAEYLPPTRMSDTSFLVPIFPDSSIDRFYITPFGNADIYYTNATGKRSRYGNINDIYLDAGPLYIESIRPILLFVKPSARKGFNFTLGDYSWIPSISQYRNKYTITNVDSILPDDFNQIVSIILPADQLDGFLVDGSPARSATGHSYLTVKGVRYVFMILSLNGPYHVIEHRKKSVTFGAFVIGKSTTQGYDGSYIFPAGVN